MTFAEFLGAYGWLIALAFLVLLILNKWYTAPDRARVRRQKKPGTKNSRKRILTHLRTTTALA